MAPTYAEPRLAPLASTFQVWGAPPRARKRSHSYSGYAPHGLWPSLGDLGEWRGGGGGRCAPPGVAACTSATSDGGSTSAPESRATEAPGSPRGREEQAGGLDEETAPELWPDTDEDEEEYEWTPCSTRRGAVAPAPVDTGAGAEGAWGLALLAPPRVLATTPDTVAACSLTVAAALCGPPTAPPAPVPLHGHAEAAPLGALGLPVLAQAELRAPAPLAAPALLPVAAVAFGGQRSPAAHTVLAGAAAATPSGADSLESAMRAAEAALAAIEAEEAASAEEGRGRAAASQGGAAAAARVGCAAGGAAGAATAAPHHVVQVCAGRAARQIKRGVTSLMLRGLPREVGQRELLEEVHRSGFAGRVDFCYMPHDFASGKNKGHAFLNSRRTLSRARWLPSSRGRGTGARRARAAQSVRPGSTSPWRRCRAWPPTSAGWRTPARGACAIRTTSPSSWTGSPPARRAAPEDQGRKRHRCRTDAAARSEDTVKPHSKDAQRSQAAPASFPLLPILGRVRWPRRARRVSAWLSKALASVPSCGLAVMELAVAMSVHRGGPQRGGHALPGSRSAGVRERRVGLDTLLLRAAPPLSARRPLFLQAARSSARPARAQTRHSGPLSLSGRSCPARSCLSSLGPLGPLRISAGRWCRPPLSLARCWSIAPPRGALLCAPLQLEANLREGACAARWMYPPGVRLAHIASIPPCRPARCVRTAGPARCAVPGAAQLHAELAFLFSPAR
ncbi:unnamed protein product, partial [Prorocentrum cordatum]